MSERAVWVLTVSVLMIAAAIGLGQFGWEVVNPGSVAVIQDRINGTLKAHTKPGIVWQGAGSVTTYDIRNMMSFTRGAENKAEKIDPDDGEPIKIRFNDGGHADIYGSLSWEVPLDDDRLVELHTLYKSQVTFERQLLRTVILNAIYMTGPLMTSAESYASRRPELLSFIEDQIMYGVYKTETREERLPDLLTGQERIVKTVSLIKSDSPEDHGWKRQGPSPLARLGVKVSNLSIKRIVYAPEVEAQIKMQQQATMQVQTAIANAKMAEQDLVTVAKKGEADAARAKWDQEIKNAPLIAEAEQRKKVAELEAQKSAAVMTTAAEAENKVAEIAVQTAELKKMALISEGEGEAEKRKLIMNADGALEKRLAAWVDVNREYAKAFADIKGPLTPSIVVGSGGGAFGGLQSMLEAMAAKTASEIKLERGVQK